MRRLLASLLFAAVPAGAQSSALHGTVYDSLTGLPLGGASVQIAPIADAAHARTTLADAAGQFRFDSLPAGRWLAGFFHGAIEPLSADALVRVVDLGAGDSAAVTLGVPGSRHLRAMLCRAHADDSTAAVFGVVHVADTGRAPDSASVALLWDELAFGTGGGRVVPRRVRVAVDPGGGFVLCGVPADADLRLRADARGQGSGDVAIAVTPAGATRIDLALGDLPLRLGHARGEARLGGVVVDEAGHAIEGARASVPGAEGDATTTRSGAFTLRDLPSGTWTAEARAIGYEPGRATVALSRGSEATARIVLSRHTATLDRVLVKGRRPRSVPRVLTEFFEREHVGIGHFVGPDEIARRDAEESSDLLERVPGLHLVPKPHGSGSLVRGRANCTPLLVLDGAPMGTADNFDTMVRPNELMAIEIYHGAETPPRFDFHGLGSRCGAVVAWTKR